MWVDMLYLLRKWRPRNSVKKISLKTLLSATTPGRKTND